MNDAKKRKPAPQKRRINGGKKFFGRGVDPSVGKATQIQPGEVRNPGGRPKEKPILETVREILNENPEIARKICENALKQAAHELGWFSEVREMLDGSEPSAKSGEGVSFNLNVQFVDPNEK